jgi:IrrE N-terminal-like domain
MQPLFLPFTPAGKKLELQAIRIKTGVKIGPYDAVEPADLARRLGAVLVDADWFSSLPTSLQRAVLVEHRSRWSAGSITVAETLFIVANPEHAETRRSVTILEELVHHALGHPKSQLIRANGAVMRTCQHDVEDEAYGVASALLMPYRDLFNHVSAGLPLAALPTLAPVSDACRRYRVKRAGLWNTYQARGGK